VLIPLAGAEDTGAGTEDVAGTGVEEVTGVGVGLGMIEVTRRDVVEVATGVGVGVLAGTLTDTQVHGRRGLQWRWAVAPSRTAHAARRAVRAAKRAIFL